jgi:hypothetical protein
VQWDFKKLRRRGRQTEVLSQDAPSWQLHLGAEPRVGTWGDEVLEAKWGRLETMYPTLAGFSLSKSFLYPSLHTHTHTHTRTHMHTHVHTDYQGKQNISTSRLSTICVSEMYLKIKNPKSRTKFMTFCI